MITILTQRKYAPAATRVLGFINELKEPARICFADTNEARTIAKNDTNTLVRYGTTALADIEDAYDCVVNESRSVLSSGHKFHSLDIMKEEGIPTIPAYEIIEYLRSPMLQRQLGFPVVLRTNHHFGGHDLRVIENLTSPISKKRLIGKDYAQKLIANTLEWRVWAFDTTKGLREGGRPIIIKSAQKVDKGEINRTGQPLQKRILKNFHNGYAFEYKDDIPEVVRELGKKALAAFQLDFGAVDVIRDEDTGEYYVLEINTAPGTASDSTASKLAERFVKIHKHQVKLHAR